VLITLTLLVAIASLALNVVILVNQNKNATKEEAASTCTSPSTGTVSNTTGFKEAAAYLLTGLDPSVDPCENFYQFTCGTYLKNTPIPSGRQRIGTYDQSQVIVNNAVVNGITKNRNVAKSKTEKLLEVAFDACMKNANQSSVDRSKAIYQKFIEPLGGFPAINGSNYTLPSNLWYQIGYAEATQLLQTLIASDVSTDYGNVSEHALYFNQGPLANPRDFYVKPQFLQQMMDYLSSVKAIFAQFARDITGSTQNLDQQATDVVAFETKLALAMVPDDLLRNYEQQYNNYTLQSLNAFYPSINWQSYARGLLNGSAVTSLASVKYVVVQPAYFGVLDAILQGNQVSQQTIVNFIVLRILQANAKFLGPPIKNAAHDQSKPFGRSIRSDADSNENAQNCINTLTMYFPYGTGYVYVKNIAERDEVAKDVAHQTEYVIDAFLNMIQSLAWITPSSLNGAQTKEKNLVRNIGWPHWFNFTDGGITLDRYHHRYEELAIVSRTDFFDILQGLQYAYQMTEEFDLLISAPDRRNFGGSPATVNAWYIPERNSITFPFAAFNPPYYRYDFPQAYNYAGQGGTGGHELSHGYDDEGVQYGPYGALSDCKWDRCGWMDVNSTLGFIDMAQCVVSQYSEQCCPLKSGTVHCANGATTQGENLADLAGQQAAYHAYRRFIKDDRKGVEEDRLPGLDKYTPNQIFWIVYGFSWCMNQEPSNLVNQLLTNPHAPGSCRVNQVMQDIPEFGRDFNCKQGSAMYPQSDGRCKVWTGV
jgi:membrane metallo-endopeptidase-like protein 1